jgi:hypothetical protein
VCIIPAITIYSENGRLRAKIHDLELEIAPFRNLAVQEYRNSDANSLKKLAELMTNIRAEYAQQQSLVNSLREEIAALQIRPIDKLLKILDEINPSILEGLKAGKNVKFGGRVKLAQKDRLEAMFDDPVYSNYIIKGEYEPEFVMTKIGTVATVQFIVSTNVLSAK